MGGKEVNMRKNILRAGIVLGIVCVLNLCIKMIGTERPEALEKESEESNIDIWEEMKISENTKSVVEKIMKGKVVEHAAKMPQIIDIIIDDNKSTALCMDGSVWTWKNKQGKAYAHQIMELDHMKQIRCAGLALYALAENGSVYVWGDNNLQQVSYQADGQNNYETPILINGLTGIKDFGVNTYPKGERGRLFAIDESENLLTYGMYFYRDEEKNYTPAPIPNEAERAESIHKICMGSGNSSFFLRNDGTVFSIIDTIGWQEEMKDCIFPSLDGSEGYPLKEDGWVNLKVDTSGIFTILYEVGEGEGVVDMAADPYTLFLYKDDNTLWYWDNKFIKYHNCSMYERPEDSLGDYSGNFKEVNINKILGMDVIPRIVDMCAGKENVLFLTEDGQVFISKYVTTEAIYTNNIECCQCWHTRGVIRWEKVSSWSYPVLAIKDLDFQRLDWKNIISINTTGEFDFSAVDNEGNYYHLCTEEEF